MNSSTPTNLPAEVPVYYSQGRLARLLGVCPATLSRRLASGALVGDAILRSGILFENVLFDSAKMPEFRAAMRSQPAIALPSQVIA